MSPQRTLLRNRDLIIRLVPIALTLIENNGRVANASRVNVVLFIAAIRDFITTSDFPKPNYGQQMIKSWPQVLPKGCPVSTFLDKLKFGSP